MSNNTAIYCCDGEWFFWDWYTKGELDDLHPSKIYLLPESERVGTHTCIKSRLYDDMEGFVDKPQLADIVTFAFPAGTLLIVCYYQYHNGDLLQLVDYGITVDDYIRNIHSQKYVEGADFWKFSILMKEV